MMKFVKQLLRWALRSKNKKYVYFWEKEKIFT